MYDRFFQAEYDTVSAYRFSTVYRPKRPFFHAVDRAAMSKEDPELPIAECFHDYTVIEYLALLYPSLPRRGLQPLFAAGRVRGGKLPVSPRARLGDLEHLSLVGGLEDIRPMDLSAPTGGVRILHEDDRIIVLAKDSGVPVVPAREGKRGSCLAFLVNRELEERESKELESYIRPRVVHRIDRLTSGAVLFARTPAAERELSAHFEAREVRKEYLALVLGDMEAARKTISVPIEPGRKGRMRCGANGKKAETVFEVIERFDAFTLLRARPISGRTHQIRVHALAAGHPLAIDPIYRPAATRWAGDPPVIERLTLHARSIELPARWSGERRFTCEPPEDFREAVEALRPAAGASSVE